MVQRGALAVVRWSLQILGGLALKRADELVD
jgi:hypothetical protein